jgi:hypothetical protein
MKISRLLFALAATAILFSSAPAALAQAGSVVRTIAKELAEKLGERGARELAEIGGEAGVREIVEKAAAEGGETLAREIAGYAEKYGAQSLRAFREAPVAMAQCMKKIPAEFAEGAMRAAAREPALVARLATEIGEDALIVAAKHPGIGVDIATKLGRDGCALAKKLTTPDTIRLARFGDDLARLPAAERTALLTRIGKAPGKVLGYLEKHPKLVLTAAATATAIVAIDRLLGDAEAPGFIERIAEQFRTPVGIILFSVAALVLARALWWWWRHARRPRPAFEK